MHTVKFIKMHALENDFVILQDPHRLTSNQVKHLSHRRKGVGCDQVLVIRSSPNSFPLLEVWNQDGSKAEACSNGTRCVMSWLMEQTHTQDIVLNSAIGFLHGRRSGPSEILASMPLSPQFDDPLDLTAWGMPQGIPVNVGNPHLVIILEHMENLDLTHLGSRLEHHPHFPNRTNVNFVVVHENGVRLRTWERGVGLTPACGSGACAAGVLVTNLKGIKGEIPVHMEGGTLWIQNHTGSQPHISHRGSAHLSFEGQWHHFG